MSEKDEELGKLQERMKELADDELLDIVEVDAADYREDALAAAKAELSARGIDFEAEPVEEDVEPAEAETAAVPRRNLLCSVCGGESRFGVLFAGRELRFLFADNKEERFLEAYACARCGRVQLLVDDQTDIQD